MFGWIRRGALYFIAFILIFVLILANLFLTLGISLSYDNIKVNSVAVTEKMFEKELASGQVDAFYDQLVRECDESQLVSITKQGALIQIDDELNSPEVNCADLKASGKEGFISLIVSSFIEQNYYKEHDCTFWECFNQEGLKKPFFIISEMSHKYFMKLFYFALLISVVLLVVAFLLMSHRTNILPYAGILIIISALPFWKLDFMLSLSSIPIDLVQIISILFTDSFSVFLVDVIVGVLFIVFGVVLKIYFMIERHEEISFKSVVSNNFNAKKKAAEE